MIIVLFVIHILIAISLVGVVLLQKSEGGALGMGGGGMSGFMTGRSTANLLTRTTAILAAAFMATSIILVLLSSPTKTQRSIIDEGPGPGTPLIPAAPSTPGSAPPTPSAPNSGAPASGAPAAPLAPAPAAPAPAAPAPAAPAEPSAPLAR